MFSNLIQNVKLILKTTNLEYTKRLIYVEDHRICFNETVFMVTHIKNLMEKLLVENCIYDDLAYKRLYIEYLDNVYIYDANPLLLYCKIPIILSADYEGLRCNFKDVVSWDVLDVATVNPIFDLPEDFKIILSDIYQRTYAYFDKSKEVLCENDFMRLAKFNFYKDWHYFYLPIQKHNSGEYRKRIRLYLSSLFDIILDFGNEDNKVTIANIINRTLDKYEEHNQEQ